MGAAAAGEYQDAGIGPFKGLDVIGKLALREGVAEAGGVLGEVPVCRVGVHVGPVEAGTAGERVTEVVDLVTCRP